MPVLAGTQAVLFDPYYSWLGIPPHEQPPNYYRLLGLSLFEQNEEAISNAADRQMAHVHSFQSGTHAADSQRLLNELALARNCLLDLNQRLSYDAHLRLRFSRSLSAIAALPVEVPAAVDSVKVPLCVTNDANCPAPPQIVPDVVCERTSVRIENSDACQFRDGISNSGFDAGSITPRTRATRSPRSLSQLLQIVSGGAAGIVLSLLLMHYVFGIDVQQLFSLPERPKPIVVKKADDSAQQRHAAPVVTPQAERPAPTKTTGAARPPETRKVPQTLPPLPEPDASTLRGSLQVEIRKPRLAAPSEADLLKVREAADAILARVRQDALSDPSAIAEQLIQQARGRNPSMRYTLLMWAAEAARAAGRFQLMCEVVDELAREQLVEALSTKARLLGEGEPSITELDDASAFVDAVALVIDEALLRFDHPTAYELTAGLMKVRERFEDTPLRAKCDAIQQKVERRTGMAKTPAPAPGQTAERRFTGLFHRNGDRGEAFVVQDGNVSEVTKENLNTITGWSQQALKGKPDALRYAAMDTLMCIARNNSSGNSQLTETELAELRLPVADLIESKDKTARAIAASILGHLPARPNDLKSLLGCLRDSDPKVRLAAAESLGKVADDSCVDPLMLAIRTRSTQVADDPREMHRLIVVALGHIGTVNAAKALNNLLTQQSDRAILVAIQDQLNHVADNPK